MKLNPVVTALLTLPLLLVACNGGNVPTSNQVSGKLYTFNASATTPAQLFSTWTGGAGTLKALNVTADLASGTVDSSGNFSVSLPTTIPNSALYPLSETDSDLSTANCTGSLSISNKTALTTVIEFAVAGTSTDGRVAPIDATYPSTADGSGQYVITASSLLYSNAATTLTGQQTCIANGTTLKSTFNINLKTGYNTVNTVYTFALNSAGKITSGSFDYINGNRASRWIVNPNLATPLSLDSQAKALSNQIKRRISDLFH